MYNTPENKYSKLIEIITKNPTNFDLWVDYAYEQEREVMCGCYEQISQEEIDKDLYLQIVNDDKYVSVEGDNEYE